MIPDTAMILMSAAIGLLVIGVGGMLLSTHLYRMLLALAIAEAGANLFLVIAGYRWDAIAPVLQGTLTAQTVQSAHSMVDPVPQAMVLTAIVIGVGVQALALSLIIRIKQLYGTLNVIKVKQLMEEEFSRTAALQETTDLSINRQRWGKSHE